jgi:molecular chaperone GrpE
VYNVAMMNGSDEEFIEEDPSRVVEDGAEEEQTPAAVKKLREKLSAAIKEKQEYLDGWQRARADFVNFKKEEALMLEEKEQRIKAELIESLLPALDSFEMALKHGATKEYELIYKQLLGSLAGLGVEKFGTVGDNFNPAVHEALTQTGDGETIQSIERSGYKVGERIIRPAQVII